METNKYIVEHFKKTGKIPKLTGFRFEDPFETAFKLPPERALEWLKQRGKNLKISIDWNELDAEAHDKAFTVAKVMNADILQLIYDFIETAKKAGWTLKQFQENLLPHLEAAGWTGATPSRLKVIYDTNMQMAYAQGKYRQQKLIAHIYPYWKYTQIQRPTKRHDHSLLNGKVFRHDDPIWKKIYPPSGFGCKCSVVPIKDNSKLENGMDYLKDFRNSSEFQLNPLEAWDVDTSRFVEGIKKQLESFIKKEISNLYDRIFEDNELMKSISEDYKKPSSEDLGHRRIAELQNFTENPKTMAQAEIDNLNLNDYFVCYRGLNGLKFYDQFKFGEYFSGRGIFGSGTYAAIDDIDVTRTYTNQKEVMKILFPKNAKVIKYRELEKDFMKLDDDYELLACKKLGLKPNEDKLILDELINNSAKLSPEEKATLGSRYKEVFQKISDETRNLRRNAYFLNDIGTYSSLLGYDAILVEDRNYLVIMNRGKCIVQKENVELKTEFAENKIMSNADLSRRLGLVWNKIPLFTEIKPYKLFKLSEETSKIKRFDDLSENLKQLVLKTEKSLGINHD